MQRLDIDRITTIWRDCRQTYGAEGALLFGQFTIADAMCAPAVLRFITYDVPLDAISRQYVEAMLALPTMQEWITAAQAEPEKLSTFEW